MRPGLSLSRVLLVIWLGTAGAAPDWCLAQNVTGYDSIPNPYLLLLREPAVHADLKLSPEQLAALQGVNDRIDGPLLSLRNKPPQQSNQKLEALISETRSQVDRILSDEQQDRLRQITLRLRGIQLVTIPDVAEKLQLSNPQRESIEQIFVDSAEEIKALKQKLESGGQREEIERDANLVRRREQRAVLGQLTPVQQRGLTELVGRPFDSSELGQAKFQAPELTGSASWINSPPLSLRKLRGKVVAVHFWAFL